ncbi:hypothetical protein DRQ36_04265 [bacterium]|nr:MAG: hypothetical protein DRQ36_04265 [bacterium]
MRNRLLICIIIIFAVLSCSREKNTEYKLLYSGPDKSEPAITDAAYVVDIFIPEKTARSDAESLAIAILKEHLESNPDCKRAKLKVYSDSVDYYTRRPEIKVTWFGAGEPQIEINRWKVNN